jgi:hypothetical protein
MKQDEKVRSKELKENVKFWLPQIETVEKLLEHAPDRFAYELRTIRRMKEYLAKWRHFPQSYQRLLRIYRSEARR